MSQKNNKSKLVISIIAVIIVAVAAIAVVLFMNGKNKPAQETSQETAGETNDESIVEEPEKTVQIYSGTDRPIAVMIDNNTNAWPQAGVNDAYMIYEIRVEGGETRLMALFKNVDLDKIGPVRSSRHYFLDYVMENDAMYAHFGASYIATEQIPQLRYK